MNVHQAEQKRMKAEAHRRAQKRQKNNALASAKYAARHLSKSGAKLKRGPRKELDMDIYTDVMREHGYVPTGKGGWRRHISVKSQVDRIAKGN